jgi:predicted alpha/beta-hydrolase family hydrolase
MSPKAFQVPGDAALTYSAMLYPADTATASGALLILAHGAGAGQSHPFMTRYARGLADLGLDIVTFNFPYMDAGRKAPDRAPVLEEAFRRVVSGAANERHLSAKAPRIFIGGKSMGGRMATHLAAAPDAWPADAPTLSGTVVFGYPLSPPGGSRVSPDRVSHLLRIRVPTLIVQGTRDTFGSPEDLHRAIDAGGGNAAISIQGVEGADHSLGIRSTKTRSQDEIDTSVWDTVAAFVLRS